MGAVSIHIQKSLVHIGRPGFRDKQTAVGHSGGKSSPRRIAEFRHGIGALRLENKSALLPQEAVAFSLGAFQCDDILLFLVAAGVKGRGQKAGGKGEFLGVREEGQTGGVLGRGKDILLPRMGQGGGILRVLGVLGCGKQAQGGQQAGGGPQKGPTDSGLLVMKGLPDTAFQRAFPKGQRTGGGEFPRNTAPDQGLAISLFVFCSQLV